MQPLTTVRDSGYSPVVETLTVYITAFLNIRETFSTFNIRGSQILTFCNGRSTLECWRLQYSNALQYSALCFTKCNFGFNKGSRGSLLFLLLQMSFVLKFITMQYVTYCMYDTSQVAFYMRSKAIGLRHPSHFKVLEDS